MLGLKVIHVSKESESLEENMRAAMISCASVIFILYRVYIIAKPISIMKRVETIQSHALYFVEWEYVWSINLIVLVHG